MGLHDLVIDGTYYDVEFRTNDKKPYPYWEMYRAPEIKGKEAEIKKIFIYNLNTIRDINEQKEEIKAYFKNEKRIG